MLEIFLILVLFIFGYIYLYKNSCGISNIPGPWGAPILGNLPFLGFEPHKTFFRWSDKYGPIIGVRLGSFPTVVINDGALIKKAMGMTELSGRPKLAVYEKMIRRKGIGWVDGPEQVKRRQFFTKSFKDFGYGGRSMEQTITDQIPQVLDTFEKQLDKPLVVKNAFSAQIVNYMWSILMGSKFAPGDSRLMDLVHRINQFGLLPPQVALAMFIPTLGQWFPGILGVTKLDQDMQLARAFMREEDKSSDENPASAEEFKEHSIAAEIFKRKDELSFLDDENINQAYVDLFGASTETTSSAMEWLIYYLVKYPEVQSKFQQEMDQWIGRDRLPTISDRANMPYVQAMIQEGLRQANVFPLAAFHSALEDVQFQGFLIPKGTVVWANLYAAHHDPQFWVDPEVFRPERFLDGEGKLKAVPDQHFMPFGTGKRSCIGETLGRNQIFLYLTAILQRYNLRAGGKLPPEKGVFGMTLRPEPFPVLPSRREALVL